MDSSIPTPNVTPPNLLTPTLLKIYILYPHLKFIFLCDKYIPTTQSRRANNKITFQNCPKEISTTIGHALTHAVMHDLSQWVAALPYLSGADIITLWPSLRAKIVGVDMYSPGGTRKQQIRTLLSLVALYQSRVSAFPLCLPNRPVA